MPPSAALRCSLLIAVLGSAGPAQELADTPFVDPANPIYQFRLPRSWQQVTPDQARAMRANLPPDLTPMLDRGFVDRFGDTAAWQKSGFDGRCLTIHTGGEGEPAMDDSTLERIRTSFTSRSVGDLRYSGTPRFARLGPKTHPVIECVVDVTRASGEPLSRALVFIIPTGGKTLRLSFRSDAVDFAAAEPLFRLVAATVELASLPEGKKELSDKLRTPLIIGALVGLVLMGLYKLRKR